MKNEIMKNEIEIKKSGGELDNIYHISGNLTAGQIIAIIYALDAHKTRVSEDLLIMLKKAIQEAKLENIFVK